MVFLDKHCSARIIGHNHFSAEEGKVRLKKTLQLGQRLVYGEEQVCSGEWAVESGEDIVDVQSTVIALSSFPAG